MLRSRASERDTRVAHLHRSSGRITAPVAAFVTVASIVPALSDEAFATDPSASPTSTSPQPLPGFTSHVVDVGAAKIHCLVGGNGPALLLIHGWPETWYAWRKMMPALARRHTVISVDLRGFGDSSLEPSGYDKKTLANDLYALLMKLGHPRADVVGHDWGGPIAYAYAAQHPEATSKLVLIEGTPFGPWMETVEPIWFFHFLRVPGGYAEKLITGREREFLRYFYDNREMHVVPVFDETVIDLYSSAYARPGRMGPSYGLYRSIDQDVRDNIAFSKTKLVLPVLAVGAQKGAGEAVAKSARAVAESVTPVLFKSTGHFIPEERPEALADVIETFLAGRPVAATWNPPAPHP
jgi:pimeloyl-ACP methyl ester carboxylesterase